MLVNAATVLRKELVALAPHNHAPCKVMIDAEELSHKSCDLIHLHILQYRGFSHFSCVLKLLGLPVYYEHWIHV